VDLDAAMSSPLEVDLSWPETPAFAVGGDTNGLADGWRRSLRRTLDRLSGP
jgi:hypothetical protein